MNRTIFPQYRSLKSFNRHYKIVSERAFIEAFMRNEVWEFQTVEAIQYPEILRIQDMLNCQFSFEESDSNIAFIFPEEENRIIE